MKQISIVLIAAVGCVGGLAQKPETDVFFVNGNTSKIRVEALTSGMATAKLGMMGQTVKGAPYAADAVTEFTQTLADGTHINRQETYTIYRDGEGRIRRESGNEVWISDPVAKVSYILDTKQQTAREMPLSQTIAYRKMQLDKVTAESMAKSGGFAVAAGSSGGSGPVVFGMSAGANAKVIRMTDANDKTESLGRQAIEGVDADGTRTTTVIPQGQIGNDRPLQIVHERWESAELHVTVLSKHSDPMMGDSVERLTNIRRGEPDPALFAVPAGYQIESGK